MEKQQCPQFFYGLLTGNINGNRPVTCYRFCESGRNRTDCPLPIMYMYVYVYVVWKAATSATMLMVNDLTRYKAATLPLHIRYISAKSVGRNSVEPKIDRFTARQRRKFRFHSAPPLRNSSQAANFRHNGICSPEIRRLQRPGPVTNRYACRHRSGGF